MRVNLFQPSSRVNRKEVKRNVTQNISCTAPQQQYLAHAIYQCCITYTLMLHRDPLQSRLKHSYILGPIPTLIILQVRLLVKRTYLSWLNICLDWIFDICSWKYRCLLAQKNYYCKCFKHHCQKYWYNRYRSNSIIVNFSQLK